MTKRKEKKFERDTENEEDDD